jgi:hypothetical protein
MKNMIIILVLFVLSFFLPRIYLSIKRKILINNNHQQYEELNHDSFPYNIERKKSDKKLLLEKALDIRKFEIELYWNRSRYFWTFIGITFGGFFALKYSEIPNKNELSYLVSLVGLVLSLAWYLGNRGSKFWQSNWEKHVDYIEDSNCFTQNLDIFKILG